MVPEPLQLFPRPNSILTVHANQQTTLTNKKVLRLEKLPLMAKTNQWVENLSLEMESVDYPEPEVKGNMLGFLGLIFMFLAVRGTPRMTVVQSPVFPK